jgi:hypothetical protein
MVVAVTPRVLVLARATETEAAPASADERVVGVAARMPVSSNRTE